MQAALQLDPDNLEILLLMANVLAAEEDPNVRNGAAARTLAERLVKLTGGSNPPRWTRWPWPRPNSDSSMKPCKFSNRPSN